MLKEQYNFKISTKNIGPLQSLNFNDNFDATNSNKKVAIYAKNGSGKTMISKLFSLCGKSESELASYNSAKLVTKGQLTANFSFKLSPSNQSNKTLNIFLIKNGKTTINNNTDYIFHVFNSEYVKENIETNKYAPNDKIEGYVIGKINIDLSQDENNLKILKEKSEKELQDIKEIYLKNVKELDLLKIDKKTKEYKDFTFESIFQPMENISIYYSDLLAQHNSLKSLPDDFPNIQELAFQVEEEIYNSFDFLNTKYIKSQMAKEIRDDITNNFDFISFGIKKYASDKSICPFCKATIDKDSQQIINNYIIFLDDKESKSISKAKEYQKHVLLQINNIENLKGDYTNVKNSFESLKKYLPSQKETYLDDINNLDETIAKLTEIVETLKLKINDISLGIDITKKKEPLIKDLQLIINAVEKINKKISKINQIKNKIGEERLLLNRKLCESKRQETIFFLKKIL
ncbi:MAG: AAA family ATPase [Clostridia bacterium]|nr:AAA family ATPase [Clostridia bacterium]